MVTRDPISLFTTPLIPLRSFDRCSPFRRPFPRQDSRVTNHHQLAVYGWITFSQELHPALLILPEEGGFSTSREKRIVSGLCDDVSSARSIGRSFPILVGFVEFFIKFDIEYQKLSILYVDGLFSNSNLIFRNSLAILKTLFNSIGYEISRSSKKIESRTFEEI